MRTRQVVSGLVLGVLAFAGCSGGSGLGGSEQSSGTAGRSVGTSDSRPVAVAGVQVTQPAAAVFQEGEDDCILGEVRVTLSTGLTADGAIPKLASLTVADRQKVADAYLSCEADAGLQTLVARGLKVGNPNFTEESAACQSKALYDGIGRNRFAALATSTIRLDDLTDDEVLTYQKFVAPCP
jgi:hypothetical protein